MTVSRFIRFADESGKISYGEPKGDALTTNLTGASVEVLSGDPFTGLSPTGSTVVVKKARSSTLKSWEAKTN